jgi:hypothetical protein
VTNPEVHEASYRDPAGFIYLKDGQILRQINHSYAEDYEHLMKSGLYEALVSRGLLIPHDERPTPTNGTPLAYKVIAPERVPFISYAYEWSFTYLKLAALAALEIMEIALEYDMVLKDCNSYNMQFHHGRPVLIDSLSFMAYQPGMLWPGYRQFCQHFLMPLALMSYCDPRLGALLARFEDGIPLDLGTRLLPQSARFSLRLLVHLFLHSGVDQRVSTARRSVSLPNLFGANLLPLVANLKGTVSRIKPPRYRTAWEDYEDSCLYSDADRDKKRRFVEECLEVVKPATLWDLGANVGTYSWLASERGASVVAIDNDYAAIDRLSQDVSAREESSILPLVADILNPTPPVGWGNAERSSLLDRGPAEMILALALLHHIVIRANVPMENVARLLSRLGNHVVIEFVPKSDPQVELFLAHREDIFPDYHQNGFEAAFGSFFRVVRTEELSDSPRVLYHMERAKSS